MAVPANKHQPAETTNLVTYYYYYLSYSDLPLGVPDLLPLYVQEKKPYYSIRVAEPPYAHSRVKKTHTYAYALICVVHCVLE